jgi:hypothetical protein
MKEQVKTPDNVVIVDTGNYYRLRLTIIPVLRLRLVIALFRGRAFLLHLPKRLSHVFHRPRLN